METLKAQIEALRAELLACQRLATLGNLTAMVTHEFNNLLTPILARSEAALLDPDNIPFMRKTLERALTQSRRAIAVTEHLLKLAHDSPRPEQACCVAAAVEEAVATLTRPLDKDSIELRVSIPTGLRVRAQPDLLCQVLLNLLLNARRAMEKTSGPLAITAKRDGDRVQIDVQDSGRGIPREQLDQVFNPFLAADPRERPTDWQQVGLGLSACRMIAYHHGATIQGIANDGRGCTFRLLWPAAEDADSDVTGNC